MYYLLLRFFKHLTSWNIIFGKCWSSIFYSVAFVFIEVRYTGGNWWTSEGKRGGNSLIHSSLSQKLWFIYRQLTDWMMEPYEQNLIHLIIKGLHQAICSASNLQSFSIDFFLAAF
ncbi:unnamed protein product [Malus baccata var. baccata]